jgi:Mn2+/Fe2+ NRAMP family transporter
VQLRLAFAPSSAKPDASTPLEGDRHVYRIAFTILGVGATAILIWGKSSFTALVDLATTLSFLTAPVLSYFNHRAIHAAEVPQDQRPGAGMTAWSWVAIVLQAAFALYFLWLKFGPSAA